MIASLVAIGEPRGAFEAVLRGDMDGRGVGVLEGEWWADRRGEVGVFGPASRSDSSMCQLKVSKARYGDGRIVWVAHGGLGDSLA
jgi:hypothetical protein